eukprot:8650141-Lingulodinium_polyedra.AAC.1
MPCNANPCNAMPTRANSMPCNANSFHANAAGGSHFARVARCVRTPRNGVRMLRATRTKCEPLRQ